MFEIQGKYTSALITIDDVEETALKQIREACNHPVCTEPIAIMPDCHAGMGITTIGFTMPLGDKVMPSMIGVDISCGMQSVKYDILADDFFKTDKDMKQFDRNVRQCVPMGFNVNAHPDKMWKEVHFFNDLNERLRKFHIKYVNKFGVENAMMLKSIKDEHSFVEYSKRFSPNSGRFLSAISSLGGGNHFQECSKGLDGSLWITVHCGSRNFGKCVCDYHQNKAWDIIENIKIKGKQDYIADLKEQIKHGEFENADFQEALQTYDRTYDVGGITKQTAFLTGTDAYEYLYDMVIASTYADWNRKIIMERIGKLVGAEVLESITTTHNFIDMDDFIIRKGAVASYDGRKFILPFNALDGILICEGKSNPDFNFSAPHGAGRLMSRSQAKKEITPEQARELMDDAGIYASVTPVDESAFAYKDATMIEQAIGPTATIIDRLTPVMNFKAN